jgi:hypothetical protein
MTPYATILWNFSRFGFNSFQGKRHAVALDAAFAQVTDGSPVDARL